MNLVHARARLATVLSATVVGLAPLACHDGGRNAIAPITVRELQIVDGDQQTAPRGDDVPSPLRVRAIGSDGNPLSGATVRWSQAENVVTFDPMTSTTDASGDAATHVHELARNGLIVVVASAAGAASASFSLAAVDPCLKVNAHPTRIDSVVHGALKPTDCNVDGQYHDFYMFTLPTQTAVTLRATSELFTVWVTSFDFTTGYGWGGVADRAHTGEASLRIVLPAGANAMGVTSFQSSLVGAYTITVTAADEDIARCEQMLVARNISTRQKLESTDCQDSSGLSYSDALILFLWEGQAVRLSESSADFTPLLRVSDGDGTVVRESVGRDAEPAAIEFTAPATAYYTITTSAVGTRVTGGYDLTVADSRGGGGPQRVARGPVPFRLFAR